jgi:hypothetical protein
MIERISEMGRSGVLTLSPGRAINRLTRSFPYSCGELYSCQSVFLCIEEWDGKDAIHACIHANGGDTRRKGNHTETQRYFRARTSA